MSPFPQNFDLLAGREENIRQLSKAAIEASDDLSLLMSGYYQSTVMVMQDLLETTFLLDYFHSNRDQIAAWQACDEKKRNR